MAVEERDKAPLADMLAAARVARMLAGGLPFDALMADVRTRLALERALEIIGEAARKVSSATRNADPGCSQPRPWRSRWIGKGPTNCFYPESEIIVKRVEWLEPGEHESIAMKEKLKRIRGSGNVFLDLGFDKAEAENLKMRSQLMMRIEDFCRQSDMTQAAAAKVLGITQPRLNALLKGNIGQFSLDALVNIATRAGLNVRLVIRKAA